MKLIIICKDDDKKLNQFKNEDDEKEVITLVCEFCKGRDIRTSIKMIMEDYGSELKDIIYPNCDILKKVVE